MDVPTLMEDPFENRSCLAVSVVARALMVIRKVVVCELDLVMEELLGVFPVVGDDPGMGIRVEQAHVQEVDADERGDPELAGLEDEVHEPHGVVEDLLSPIRVEKDLVAAQWQSRGRANPFRRHHRAAT